MHLSASPFHVTLTLDSDAGFCGRIDEPFKKLEGFDFVVSNHVKDPYRSVLVSIHTTS